MLSILQFKNHKSSQMLHTGLWPLIEETSVLDVGGEVTAIWMFPSFCQRAPTASDFLLPSPLPSSFCIRRDAFCTEVSQSLKLRATLDRIQQRCKFFFFLHTSLLHPAFPASAVFSSSENLPSHQTHTPVPHCQPPPLHPPTHPPLAQPLSKVSDWIVPCCRYHAPLKSIFLSESLAPAPLLPFPLCLTPLPSSSWDPSVRSDLSPFGVAVSCTMECSNYPSK